MALDDINQVDNRRACRPFSDNAGFTLAEAAIYVVLMDDVLALDLGAEIYGSVPDVFINADGFKKSIPSPGIGNYVTVAKAMATARSLVGDDGLQKRSYIHAHGTGTPQNRVTESEIMNELAKTFGITNWPVAAVKAYLGHTLAPAAGDQLTSALGTWKYGLIPGIATIDHLAEDVREYDQQASRGESTPIYQFGEGVLEGQDINLTDTTIQIPGFEQPIELNVPNAFSDMTD